MKSKSVRTVAILGSVALFCTLYFGFSNVDKGKKSKMDAQRALTSEVTNETVLLKEARTALSADTLDLVERLAHLSEEASSDSVQRLEALKRISGVWFASQKFALAGINAERVAEIERTAEAWGIAGTTFANGVKRLNEGKERDFCAQRAINAFEKAISLNPDELEYRLNLATVYTEMPPKDNPMKGIQMLLQLNENQPDNIAVLNKLAQLAIKTGQFDKAVARLEKSYQLQPNNIETVCLLSIAYDGVGNHAEAEKFAALCK